MKNKLAVVLDDEDCNDMKREKLRTVAMLHEVNSRHQAPKITDH